MKSKITSYSFSIFICCEINFLKYLKETMKNSNNSITETSFILDFFIIHVYQKCYI
jgi:hypothetical protein